MKKFVYSLLIIGLISGMLIIELVKATTVYHESGTFEDFPNMDGNWERCSDWDGPLEVDTSRKVYIDIDACEDVFSCSANFYSYANNPNYNGEYSLSASINLVELDSISIEKKFNGPWWEYSTNVLRQPQIGNLPQNISVTTAYSGANGRLTVELNNDSDSGSNSQPILNPETQLYPENSVSVSVD
ncbi:hypothetical protein JT359_17760 [Candidatus Poribacteria bacterium]|nr:hypothetical protein [Candidatus Poribacteria bacterium]